MNVIDVLAILPYYVSLFFMSEEAGSVTTEAGVDVTGPTLGPEEEEGTTFDDVRRIVQVFRIMRIMRIFKLARYGSSVLKIQMRIKTSFNIFFPGTPLDCSPSPLP